MARNNALNPKDWGLDYFFGVKAEDMTQEDWMDVIWLIHDCHRFTNKMSIYSAQVLPYVFQPQYNITNWWKVSYFDKERGLQTSKRPWLVIKPASYFLLPLDALSEASKAQR